MSAKPSASKIRHPAQFTDAILDEIGRLLHREFGNEDIGGIDVLDPFAGTGKGVGFLWWRGFHAVGIELEPEWAGQSNFVYVGNACDLPFADGSFDAVVTSPCYGNRMADHHEALDDSRRNTYRHALGRPLSDGSAAAMQWGPEYRDLHICAWTEACRVLRPGGVILVNIKDHIRKGERQYVSAWHCQALQEVGFEPVHVSVVPCPGNRQGANGAARIPHEYIWMMRKPA